MNKFLPLALVIALGACSESVHVITNEERVSELERRAALNDMLDSMQSDLISFNTASIDALALRVSDLEAAQAELEQDLSDEAAMRLAGDEAEAAARAAADSQLSQDLNDAVAAQRQVNSRLRNRISNLNDKVRRERQQRIAGDERLLDLLRDEERARIRGDRRNERRIGDFISAQLLVNSDLQSQIDATNSNLDSAVAALEGADAALEDLINSEIASAVSAQQSFNSWITGRVNGLQLQITLNQLAQSFVNAGFNARLNSNSSAISALQSSLAALQVRMSSAEGDINSLESQVASLSDSLATINATVNNHTTSISSLVSQVSALENEAGDKVQVYKCNASSSKENMFKIGQYFYAVINRVTTQSISLYNASGSPTTVTVPAFCTKNDNRKFADVDGECSPSWTLEPAQNVSIPSGSSSSVTVVTGVQISLEKLSDGSYHTTDGGPACYFSISNGGTISSNLVLQ